MRSTISRHRTRRNRATNNNKKMPFIKSNLLATKARRVTEHQEDLLFLKQYPNEVSGIDINPDGFIEVKTKADGKKVVGVIHDQWIPALGRPFKVVNYEVTGGRPTDFQNREGRLMQYLGFNLKIEIEQ